MSNEWDSVVRLQLADGTTEARTVEIGPEPTQWDASHVHAYAVNIWTAFEGRPPNAPTYAFTVLESSASGATIRVTTSRGVASTVPLPVRQDGFEEAERGLEPRFEREPDQ